jgi:hypothetical protein
MSSYCERCGHNLYDGKCLNCGKNHGYNRIDSAKGHLKRTIKKHFHVPHVAKIIVVVMIVALAVILSYILFSNPKTYGLTTQEKNQIIQNAITSDVSKVKTALDIKPKLSVFHQMVSQFDFGRGCFGKVTGGVTNKGAEDAVDVVITCTTSEGISSQQVISYIAAGKTETFQILLDYDCKVIKQQECTVTCSNC